MNLRFRSAAILWVASTLLVSACASRAQILFDNTKAETAGNADWIIDTSQPVPSPSITGINASTSESYWTGALSSWGVALAKLLNSGQISLGGNGLETLPTGGQITYSNASNAQDLSHYKVYVVCEPNILFTAAEKTAIVQFVQNGGGLFMVADHSGSDRNNDGNDSLTVWNDLMSNNSVQSNPFGFSFNVDDSSPTGTADGSATNPITHGIAGTVGTLTYSSGCTMNINNTATTHKAVWSSADSTKLMCLYGTFGAGRFVAIGDSSVVEDVTSSGGTTFAGWTTPVDNGYCAINGTVWLLSSNAAVSPLPVVTTGAASAITTNGVTFNGTVNPEGLSTTSKFLYGLTTSYGSTVAVSGTQTGTNAVGVSASVTGLAAGTTYHFAVVATNSGGSVTGVDQTFTTVAVLPIVTTTAASSIGTNTATLNGTVNPSGSATGAQFLYGLTTNYGSIATVSGTLTGTSAQAVSAALTGLTPSTTYHFAVKATNAYGSATGADQTFATTAIIITTPIVTTGTASSVSTNTATLNGTVNPSGSATSAQFLYGLTTNYGSIATVSGSLTGTNALAVNAPLTGLAAGTLYHFMLTASNSSGSGAGTDQTLFTTPAGGGGGSNYTGVLAGWDANAVTNFGTSPLTPSNTAPNISVTGLTRGTGVTTPSGAATRGWGGAAWTSATSAAAITANQFVTFGITASNGYTVSFSSVSEFDYRHSGTGPTNGLLQYSVGGGAFSNITTLNYPVNSSGGASLGAIDLTGIAALQNVPAGTNVTFRIVNYSASNVGGTWYVYDVSNSTAADFAISGTVASTQTQTLTPIQTWRQQWFGTIANSGNAADGYVASSDGMPNLLKYALGLNPLATATNPITGGIVSGFLSLTVPRNSNATDITYLVESATNIPGSWSTNRIATDVNTSVLLRAHDTNAVVTTPKTFIRLHVTDP